MVERHCLPTLLTSCLLFIYGVFYVSGSLLTLNRSPATIVASLSNSLTIRCSINGTPSAIVGRSTSGDMQFLMSLVVTRQEGEHVASITRLGPAKALTDLSNLQVSGDLSGSNGELGYLELTWDHPTELQAGQYFCEANGMNMAGHGVLFQQTVSVNFTQPTLSDLANHIQNLAAHLKQKDDYILTLVNKVQHIENGTIMCGDSNNWHDHSGFYRYKDVTISFNTAYDKPPVVHYNVVNFRNQYSTSNSYFADFNIMLHEVSETSFTLRCQTHHTSSRVDRVYVLDANWISFPQ